MSATSPPPAGFASTREALRALACYVIAPARKARTGRIGLRPTGSGFGTPPFDDGGRIVVDGAELLIGSGRRVAITTLRAAAADLGIELTADPGVGHDLPPFTPDTDLSVDAAASHWLGRWYAFGADHLGRLVDRRGATTISEAQLWPEHFDLAVIVELGAGNVNVGFSPGDAISADPYVYVGPHDTAALDGDYWNTSFGAILRHDQLRAARDPDEATTTFIETGLHLVEAQAT